MAQKRLKLKAHRACKDMKIAEMSKEKGKVKVNWQTNIEIQIDLQRKSIRKS
jgi:hypothetical protein